jgi:hypothetical protein
MRLQLISSTTSTMPPTTYSTVAPWYVRCGRAFSETWSSLKDEWLGWISVILLTLSFVGLVFLLVNFWRPNEYISNSTTTQAQLLLRAALGSNFVGTLWVLTGTLWCILGVFIPASQVSKLQEWEARRALPPDEVLRALRVASNFGKSGSVFILIGSVILLGEMLAAALRAAAVVVK